MFLTTDDYKSVCDDFEFEQLQADQYRETAEQAALETIASYTRHRYDIQTAFQQTGTDRNPMLVQCAVNITLYLMIHRMPQSMGHDRRQCLYDDAIRWLKDVQSSKASPDLPTYTSPDGTDTDSHNPVKWGSMEPNQMTW